TEADFWTEEIWEIVEGIVKKDIKSHINSMGNRHIEEYPGKLHELLKPQDREPWILWLNKYREARVLVHLLDGGKFIFDESGDISELFTIDAIWRRIKRWTPDPDFSEKVLIKHSRSAQFSLEKYRPIARRQATALYNGFRYDDPL
ncbi:hypothetical protein JCM3766R1_000350, partial [Sporobolomyces carnicolor]